MSTRGTPLILNQTVVTAFQLNGYYLYRGLFERQEVEEARAWLTSQNPDALAKSWTEQEPGVPLAVFSVVHKGDHPIAKLATDPRIFEVASQLMRKPVYLWASKVNLKAAWCGTVEYYHQDLVYWKDRGYPRHDMMSCMVFQDPHTIRNAALHVLPGTHRLGFIEHMPFININGLAKFMVPPDRMHQLYREHGLVVIEGEPGDALFFHAGLIHGSSHNISPHSRMVVLSQLNAVGNEPPDVSVDARAFNLRRAELELREAERRTAWFRRKYEEQLRATELTFGAPIPEEERLKGGSAGAGSRS